MSIYFNEKFKQLRKTHDLTQDQIADIFHVSPQAVSRWETGATYPDIEILPHIAMFFKVTVDELLGTELIAGEKKAKEYKSDIWRLLNVGKVCDAVDTARKAVKEYPVNYDLQAELMNALCIASNSETTDEIIEIGERIINYCTDQSISLRAKHTLFMQYVKWGMKEEAKKIVCTLPSEEWYAYGANVGYVLEGEEWRQNQQTCICRYTYQLCGAIRTYADITCADSLQKIERLKKMMQIYSVVYDDEGDLIVYSERELNNIAIAELYCRADDVSNALNYLEKATQDSIYRGNNWNRKWYKSSLLLNRSNVHERMEFSTPRNMCWVLWEDWLMKPQFDIIRNEERFIKCFETLKANSGELT